MNGSTTSKATFARRLALASGFVALCITVCPSLPGQRRPGRGFLPAPQDPRPTADRGGTGARMFSLPRSQDDTHEWRLAREEMASGRLVESVERLHRLLLQGRPGVVPVDEVGDRFMGLRHAVIETLRDMSAEGREAYERLTQREAGALVRTAFESVRPRELEWLAHGFPTSSVGLRARMRLADLALEAGQGSAAVAHYRAALDAASAQDPLRKTITQRLIAAEVLSGVDVRRSVGPQARTLIDDVESVLFSSSEARARRRGWPAYGGGSNGALPMQAPPGQPRPAWREDIRPRGFENSPYAMQAVGGISGVYINDGVQVYALDALTGRALWVGEGPLSGMNGRLDLFENVNPNTILSASLGDDIVLAALLVPPEGESVVFRQISVLNLVPSRRLFAFDRTTGKRLWSHYDRADGPISRRFKGHDVCGPVLVDGDTAYVPTHDQTGAIAFYLTAYDLKTGNPRWRRLVCSSQQEVNMFGNARFEFAASPMAIHGGVLYGTTSLGVCFAADAATGEIRWISAYPVIDLPQTRLTNQRMREVHFANNPIVIVDNVMATTPLDSPNVLGFDLDSGRLLWTLEYRAVLRDTNDVRWLLGAIGDEFILSGRGVVAVKARPAATSRPMQPEVRQIVSPDRLGLGSERGYYTPALPRGAVAEDMIWFPSPEGLRVFDRRGDDTPRMGDLRGLGQNLGNLLLSGGLLVSVRSGPVEAYYSSEAMLREAETRVRTNPEDPHAYLQLGELLRVTAGDNIGGASADQAEGAFRKGLEVARREGLSPESDLHRRLAAGLLELSMARAESLARTRPADALILLRRAREATGSADTWMRVQERILGMLQNDPPALLSELEEMGRRHGETVYFFTDAGEMQTAAYVLWQKARRGTPAVAMDACQELLERFPALAFAGLSGRDFALARQKELLVDHGQVLYATLEQRAEEALQRAARDPDQLRAIAGRFPLSDAASKAAAVLLDLAVERGDLSAAAGAYAEAAGKGEPSPGILRRMARAASTSGNEALARTLARRLVKVHGGTKSDFGPDGGRDYKTVFADPESVAIPNLPLPRAVQTLPLEPVIQLPPRLPGSMLMLAEPAVAEGFKTSQPVPLYVISEGDRLQAYDMVEGPALPSPLFELTLQGGTSAEELLQLCGDTLLVVEYGQVRGVHFRTGAESWRLPAGPRRHFTALGVEGGILHLFSKLEREGDGGILHGVEPMTGTLLHRHVFPALRQSITPTLAGDEILVFDEGAGGASGSGARTAEARVVILDGTTGRITGAVPLNQDVLRSLGLQMAGRRSLRARAVQERLSADADAIYLAEDAVETTTSPRVCAVTRTGQLRWSWQGTARRTLRMAAPFADRIVVVEAGEDGGRVVQLDRITGAVVFEYNLRSRARILNWQPTARLRPAPNPLLVVDATPVLNVTMLSLDSSLPSFRHALPTVVDFVAGSPVVGEGFLAVAGHHRTNDSALVLQVLDLRDRRSLFVQGETFRSLDVGPPLRMAVHGDLVVVQSKAGITVLGTKERRNR